MLVGVAKNLMPNRDSVNVEFCSGMDGTHEPNFPFSDRIGSF